MYNYQNANGGQPIPRLAPVTSDHPYGTLKNDDPAGSGDGTPCVKEWAADPGQAMYAILNKAGIVPNGSPETVNNSQLLLALQTLFSPIGTIIMYFGDTAPSDVFLVCNGQSFTALDYPDLAILIPSLAVPDFRGRAPFCYDATDSDHNSIGLANTPKPKTVTLIADNLPPHTHAIDRSSGISGSENTLNTQFSDIGTAQSGQNTTANTPVNILNPYVTVNFLIKAK